MMTIKNCQLNEVCQVDFKKRGWSGKNAFEVEGSAYNESSPKEKRGKIWGKWTESLSISVLNGNGTSWSNDKQIWVGNPLPPQSDSMYNFTYFTLQLNFYPPSLNGKLPPTDSRLRPDQRALEMGDLVRASDEKARLEDKQRIMRKDRELQGREFKSRYFEQQVDEDTGEPTYKYIRDYWADRSKGDWSHLEEIF